MINFDYTNITKDDLMLVAKIARRASVLFAIAGIDRDLLTINMDIMAAHQVCPLDLDVLDGFDDGDFNHDIAGIYRHLNRETGALEGCFVPRCAR